MSITVLKQMANYIDTLGGDSKKYRQAIAEAEKNHIEDNLTMVHEPVAYIHRNEYNEYRLEPHDNFDIKSIPFNVNVDLFKSPQRKPEIEQEPDDLTIAYMSGVYDGKKQAIAEAENKEAAPVAKNENGRITWLIDDWPQNCLLYTHTPPQRQWVGLTPQERDEINEQVYGVVPHHVAFHHAIEAKLKEKNT